ncbi:GNAT family N-acetyltransferase [Mucilaginibacter sp. CSA2-8R]|uniref:GNAT family N-acetyltransferase n=1 Tax=Mucilaginibacter sp. CSA2-8R TaxID=3141542 RepID=UPI00315CF5AD
MPITQAQLSDVPVLNKLVNNAYRGETSKLGWTSESHLLEGIRIDEDELSSYFARPEIAILKYTNSEDEIVGCVYLEKTANQRLYLGMLSVNPLMQNASIGRQLLMAADEYARREDCKFIKISVITSRHELIAWYQRRGFMPTGETIPLITETSIAKVPVDLMIMEKPV